MAQVTSRIVDISGFRGITSYMDDTSNWLSEVHESQQIFEKMLDDARVGSLVELRKDRVQHMEGTFNATGDSVVDEAVKKHLNFNIFFNLNNILLNAISFGLSCVEVIWKKKDLLVPVSFVPIPRTALSYPLNSNDFFMPHLTEQNITLDNPYKFIIHRNDTGNGDRWGTSVLRRAYWPWRFKTMGMDAWIFAAKKIGVPSILAIFEARGENESKARARDLVDALQHWENGSSGALGNVKDLKVIDSTIKDFNTLVETCNAEIAYALTGQSLATNEAQYGTRAQSDVHISTMNSLITKDAYLLQQADQKLVNAFCALNFPGRQIPIYDIDSSDIASWSVIREAIDRGIEVSKTALYDKIRIPRPKNKEDIFAKSSEGFGFSDDFFFRT